MLYEVIKKFIKSSASIERAALDIYERLPLFLRYRLFYGYSFFRLLGSLKESDDWDSDRIYTFQVEQAKALLTHAMKHVPYYRNLYAGTGFRPDKIQSLDDLRTLPYLEKNDVRDAGTKLIDERIHLRFLIKRPTGGSSGIPLMIYGSKESNTAFLAFRANILGRIGYAPKAREVMLWHYLQLGDKSLPSTMYGNKLVLSMRYITVEWLLKCLDMIRKFEPRYVLGYPSWLTILSTIIKHHNLPPYQNIKAVIPYSETLYGWQRELMEQSFGSRVFSMYALNESVAIGGECERSFNLHLHPLYGLVEFADTAHGHKEIVATGFTNYAMPFIRYRTGDLVSDHSDFCDKCGRHHKIVERIEGRVHDWLIGKKNELINIRPLWISGLPNILQCQFFQEEPGKVYLKIVPSKTFSMRDKSYIKEELDRILGPAKEAVDMELVIVDHVDSTPSGKINLIEQKLDVHELTHK